MSGVPSKIESSFFASLLMFIFTIAATFIILLVYAPSKLPLKSDQIEESRLAKSSPVAAPSVPILSQGQSWERGANLEQTKEPSSVHQGATTKESENLLNEAMTLLNSGNVQGAMSLLEKILNKDPFNEIALVELAMIYLIDLKDPANAQNYFEKALKVNPSNGTALTELLDLYEETGNQEGGLSFLQNLYDEQPEHGMLANGIGQILMAQGRTQEALNYLEEGAKNSKGSAELADLAAAYSQLGQGDKAVESYLKIAETAQEKYDSGMYSHDPSSGRESVAVAYMDVLGELYQQKRYAEATQIEEKLKKLYEGNVGELSQLFNKDTSMEIRH